MKEEHKTISFMIIFPLLIIVLLVLAFIDTTLFLYVLLAIFIFASVFLLLGKGAWYVAGYNVLSGNEKSRFTEQEVSKLCRLVGVIHLPFVLLIASIIISNRTLEILSLFICVIVLVVVLIFIVRMLNDKQ